MASKRDCPQHLNFFDNVDLHDGFVRTALMFRTGRDSMFDKMDQVREQQERLAKLHFELDSQQEMKG